jgi:hypothetical protein
MAKYTLLLLLLWLMLAHEQLSADATALVDHDCYKNLDSNSETMDCQNYVPVKNSNQQFDKLTGTSPADIVTKAPKLKRLRAAGNALTGTIPHELANASWGIEHIDLSHNQLTGDLSFVELRLKHKHSTLQWINLEHNKLGGMEMNASFIALTHKPLDPPGTGEGPPSSDELRINLDFNYPGFFLPENVTALSGFTQLKVVGCIGTIPASWGTLTNLQDLRLSENRLTGEIPAEFENIEGLTYFMVQGDWERGGDRSDPETKKYFSPRLEGETPEWCLTQGVICKGLIDYDCT